MSGPAGPAAGGERTTSGAWAAPEGWTAHEDWISQHDEQVHAGWHLQPGRAAQDDTAGYDVWATRDDLAAAGGRELDSAGPHGPGGKTARKWAGKKVVPAAAAAATLAVGAAAFTLFGSGGGHPQVTQLNDAVGVSGTTASAGAGQLGVASSPVLKFAPTAAPASPKPAGKHAKAPAAKPSSSAPAHVAAAPPAHVAAAPPAAPASAAAATKAAAPSASSPASSTPKTLSCDLSGGLLPDNVSAIVSFLLAHGYSDNAAAGIAGNIYQESKGNPESVGMGGGGLIGWTPLPSGFVTGNVTADLDTQLAALLTYNQGWSQYIAELNAASSPADAAYIYVTMFERAGIPAASTREAAATDVASACGI